MEFGIERVKFNEMVSKTKMTRIDLFVASPYFLNIFFKNLKVIKISTKNDQNLYEFFAQ